MKTLPLLAIPALAASMMFCAPSQAQWKPVAGTLKTRWATQVSPQNALPAYPRPQLARKNWQNLNGLWSYGLTDAAATSAPAAMNGQILVPFPYESALSGVGKPSPVTQRIWYRRTFTVPAAWSGQRILLHFGAVNYDATVLLNGRSIGGHRGGYDEFSFDITGDLRAGNNELVVSASNPIAADVLDTQVVGKQRITPGGIFYTGASGIWQTVWLEPVPLAHIDGLRITPDIDASVVRVAVNSGSNLPVRVTALDGSRVVAVASGRSNRELTIPIPNTKLWSPDSPFLYDLKVDLGTGRNFDSATSYFGMRKISLGKDAQGRQRIFFNNRFLLQVGALDQGYWPDGIYTAPTDDALKYDVQIAKTLGWNMLRKHAKVEPARWYYHADKIGMLVWQDMPQMFGANDVQSDRAKAQFNTEWREIMTENHNSPAIVVWTTFNEGMGQHDTERVVARTKAFDPSRLVNATSGWHDKNVGDMHDSHVYPGPGAKAPEAYRAAVNGEFGGITMAVAGHRFENNAEVMGYGATIDSGWLATKRYQQLLKNAYDLSNTQGTSAFVYTQLTDVEQEINGLLTYDRAVMKPDVKIVAAANKGVFLPLPPNPNPQLVPTSAEDPINWQYTTERPVGDWFSPNFSDTGWKTGPAPFGHDAGGVRTQWQTNDIWIRRQFTLPNQIPAKLNLLVMHDDAAEVYVNGVLAATLTGYTGDYKAVPLSAAARATLKPGVNTFAVHVNQTVGGQAIDVGLVAAR